MASRQPFFFDALEKYDPEFYKAASALRISAEGNALDEKTRVLITMALDASHGSVGGVKNLAKRARALGATEDQVRETLRLVASVNLNMALHASLHAFEE
ncbi:MAG: carboxymuconolactone decarboxylase family protein [Dehalococcoidia bacterium]|nr:carboxymuconolactone decarboxylase family protein [Dehalococcoidia bacterium]